MNYPCRHPGCNQLLRKSGLCEDHQRPDPKREARKRYEVKRGMDEALSNAARIRSGKRWQKTRAIKMARDPLCEDPLGDHARLRHTMPTQQVHHIKPLATHPELAYHLDNLMSVCIRCHSKIEAKIR